MIEKIKNINNVGRFRLFQGSHDSLSFDENTFIFGKNAQGKSTLTSILKSLSINNDDYVIGRKTFGKSNQNIVIKIDSDYIFNNGWNRNCKMKIFDNDYITENIYNNDLITEDKQQNIVNIILGEKGKELEKNWIDAKNDVAKNANRRKEISKQYSNEFNKEIIDFKNFLLIKENDKIDDEIDEKNNELRSFENIGNINILLTNLLEELDVFYLKKEKLEKTLELDQEMIKNHLNNNLESSDNSMNFLSSGLSMMKDGICPFCSQEIAEKSAIELMNAYNTLFCGNYREIKNYVNNSINFLDGWDFEKNILSILSQLKELGLEVSINKEIDSVVTNNKKVLLEELNKKNDDLTYIINFDSFDSIVDFLNNFKQVICDLKNKYVDNDAEKVSSLKNDLYKLDLQKVRYEKIWKDVCDEYIKLEKDNKEKLKPVEINAFKEKNNYANSVLNNYNDNINYVLGKLNAGFELVNFSIPQNRRGEIKLFGLKFDNFEEEIPLINSDQEYNLKNTLSDSDKRLLAFAFFIADIKNTDDLAEYIIVLDDPMSSFDSDRKRQTVKVLRDELLNFNEDKPQQLIVLTHEINFFVLLDKFFRDNKVFLDIKYITGENTSKMFSCNIDDFKKSEYYKKLEYYKNCSGGMVSQINLSDIRIVLEEVIKLKYYLKIDQNCINSGGIISWYKENVGSDAINKKIEDIEPHLAHHTQSNNTSQEDYGELEKKSIVDDFLSLIEEI